jgi:hypothetical protein
MNTSSLLSVNQGARLHIGEPYTGHLWCLLSWEAQHTTIEINSILELAAAPAGFFGPKYLQDVHG